MKLGITLFSLTNAFLSREYSFEQLLARIAELGLGPGVEVIGFQSIRGFPQVSAAFADRFQELMSKHGLVPSCLGSNADVALRRGKLMSTEESVEYHRPQLEAAAKLGFPLVRYQFAASPAVIERLVPLAERLQVILALEVHAPHTVSSPAVVAYREMYERVKSPFLGFIPDFGSAARTVPEPYLDTLRQRGIREDLIQTALEIWHTDGEANDKRGRLAARIGKSADAETVSALSVVYNILSPQPASAWREIMPQVVHIHGKFYDFDEQGNEVCIPYDELLPVFEEGGFNGYLSSEWEGHMYSLASGFEMVQQHHALCKRIFSSK